MALFVLGQILDELNETEEAAIRTEEALIQFRAVGHSSGTAFALSLLAGLADERGDTETAVRNYCEALELWAGLNERWAIARALVGLAALAATHGQPEKAASLLGAIDARLQESGSTVFPTDRGNHEIAVASATAALGGEQFAVLRVAGRSLSLQETVELASSITVDEPPGTAPQSPNTPQGSLLTDRGLEVLRLIAEWRTDQEIADDLFISRRTVNTHVSNILAKLGVPNRRDAVALMQERGLFPKNDENSQPN